MPATPHNREAEEALIGAVLINPDAYHDLAAFLGADDFYLERHRWVWQAFGRLQETHTPLDLLTLSESLDRAGKLAEVGGTAYLTGLIASTPTSLHAEAYGRMVEEAAVRRRMLQAAGEVARLAGQSDDSLEDLSSQAEQALRSATDRRLSDKAQPLSCVLDRLFKRTGETAEARTKGRLRGIPTGFTGLDKLLLGMQPSDVLVVAGRPGMGKTAFGLSVSRHAAQVCGKRVAFFSLEMSAEQIGLRLLAQQSGIDTQRLREGLLSADEWIAYSQAVETLAPLPLMVDETPEITPQQMSARCRRMQRDAGLDLVVVDYMQLMRPGGRFENRTQEISHISRQLKTIAKELNVPVLSMAQLSRAVEQRVDKRPILSDLRESGSIEQDADVVIFLYRSENGLASQVEVSIAKHRNGPTGTIQLPYRAEITRFENPTS